MSFFAELKRRNVFKVGAAYLVVAWLIIQLVNNVAGPLRFPTWIPAFFIVLLGIGFPIALLLAWALELTPEGIKLTTTVEPEESIRPQTGQKLNRLIIVGLAAALVLVIADAYILSDHPAVPADAAQATSDAASLASTNASTNAATDAAQAPVASISVDEKSIVVLPFANLSNDPEQEYFSDGLTDEFINKLSQVRELLVIGRNSSFHFKGRSDTLEDIGKVLDVAYILQGSVSRAGNRMRINAQLMEAASGYNLWSRTYDRPVDDIFSIQDEIANEVTTALSISLGVGAFNLVGMTRDVAAYDAYLKAQAILADEGLEPLRALEHIQQALDLDPQFALAWLSQAWIYELVLITQSGEQGAEYARLRQDSLATAAALAPGMPDILAFSAQSAQADGDWIAADRFYRELLATDAAALAEVNRQFGQMLNGVGKVTEALPYLQRAKRLNPVGGFQVIVLAHALLAQGRLDEAVDIAEKGIASGEAASVQFLTAIKWMAAFAREDFAQAIIWLEQLPPTAMERGYVLPVARLLAANDTAAALATVEALAATDLSPVNRAALTASAAVAGAPELAATLHSVRGDMGSLSVWVPISSNMRKTAQFKQWIIDSGLRDYYQTTGWNDFCRPLPDTENDFECF